jgi:hypothetical protein
MMRSTLTAGSAMTDGRHTRMVIWPRSTVRQASAALHARLRVAAQANGYAQLPRRVWCPHCASFWDWDDIIVGEVEGTSMYLPLCPTADCPGIGWLHLQDADTVPAATPDHREHR